MSKKIVFKINREGNVLIDEVHGYGSGCLDATKFIEKQLGGADEGTRKLTEEFEEPISEEQDRHIEH